MLGAFLARVQGLGVLRRAQEQMGRGQFPAGSLFDGVMILVAASLLVTPGVLTDAVGFLLLVPAFRSLVKGFLRDRYRRAVEENRIRVHVVRDGFQEHGPMVDMEPMFDREDEEETRDFDVPKYRVH